MQSKKKSLLALIFSLVLLTNVCQAQEYTLEKIESILATKYIDFDSSQYKMIVIEGIPYTKTQVNTALANYQANELKEIYWGDITKIYHHKNKFVVILGTGKNQKNEEKAKLLAQIRENLNENIPKIVIEGYLCQTCFLVVLDGKPLADYKAQKIINTLKIKEIDFIAITTPSNPSYYGARAKNGLVEIYLK